MPSPKALGRKASKVLFTDLSGGGLVEEVMVNEPLRMLSVEYQGLVLGGKEDFTSEDAVSVKGSEETCLLTDKDGQTELSVKADVMPEYFDPMSLAWERALLKVKLLAEER